MNMYTLVTFFAFSISAVYLFALGTDWLLEKRFKRVLILIRRKESFEQHVNYIQECMLTFQFLENILLLQAASRVRPIIELEVNQRWDSIANLLRKFHSDPELGELCESLAEYKRQQQEAILLAHMPNSGFAPQLQAHCTYPDIEKVTNLLAAASRNKTHETFHAVCMQFSPFFWLSACIPVLLISYFLFELLDIFHAV